MVDKKLNIIIFGASGSIGKYLLEKYYYKKHNLLLFIKSKNKIKEFKKRYISNKSQEIFFERLDIRNKIELKKKIFKNKNFIKKSNLIINTIGTHGEIKNFFKLNLNKFYNTLEVNFLSQIFLFKNIYNYIKKNRDTLFIIFSGGGVTSVRQNFSPYSLSKIALVKLVEILSLELKNKNLRINAISPGIIDSKMTQFILQNNSKEISKKEISKIKKDIINSKKSLEKIYNLISILSKGYGKKISGKIISSRWDSYMNWKKKDIKKIVKRDIFTLRRVEK